MQNEDETLYDHFEFNSEIEHRFAKAPDDNRYLRLYINLPIWFTVDTPVGSYNPDWIIMFESGAEFYLICKAKGSLDAAACREVENIKICCDEKHFEVIGVHYRVATSPDDLATQVMG